MDVIFQLHSKPGFRGAGKPVNLTIILCVIGEDDIRGIPLAILTPSTRVNSCPAAILALAALWHLANPKKPVGNTA